MSEKIDKLLEAYAIRFSQTMKRIIDDKTLTNQQKLDQLKKVAFYMEKAKEIEKRKKNEGRI